MGMRVSCLQDNLARGLNIVQPAVGTRSTLPVLSNILLTTDNGRLRLAATNLEMGITAWIGASVEEDGGLTVPARTFKDLVGTLSPERVDLDVAVRNMSLNLACGATTARINGIDMQEFPIIQEPHEDDDWLPIPADLLRDAIKMVAFAAAKDDSRPILTGVLVSFDNGVLTLAAADGFRLAVKEVQLEDVDYYGSFDLVIPAKTLHELGRVSADETDMISLVLPSDHSQVLFHMTNIDMSSQLIDGMFPNYQEIIPNDIQTRTILDKHDLLRACKRADIFARESNHTARMSIEPQDGTIGVVKVSANSSETGENEVVLDATIEGEGMEIAFNVRYLIEVLNVIDQDRVMLGTIRSDKPGVLRPLGDDSNYTYVIMPMHIGR